MMKRREKHVLEATRATLLRLYIVLPTLHPPHLLCFNVLCCCVALYIEKVQRRVDDMLFSVNQQSLSLSLSIISNQQAFLRSVSSPFFSSRKIEFIIYFFFFLFQIEIMIYSLFPLFNNKREFKDRSFFFPHIINRKNLSLSHLYNKTFKHFNWESSEFPNFGFYKFKYQYFFSVLLSKAFCRRIQYDTKAEGILHFLKRG